MTVKRYVGYHEKEDLPIKPGDRVRIKRGVVVKRTFHGSAPAGRTYVVIVHHLLSGSTDSWSQKHLTNPTVRWAGSGGYWAEADINDVEKV